MTEGDHDPIAERALAEVEETVPCPDDWAALRITPESVELWSESPDRLHVRRPFTRTDNTWKLQLLAP